MKTIDQEAFAAVQELRQLGGVLYAEQRPDGLQTVVWRARPAELRPYVRRYWDSLPSSPAFRNAMARVVTAEGQGDVL